MTKRIRQLTAKYVRRVGALFATFCLSVSLMMPFASAASVTEADMPSRSDFRSHYGSWFVWRLRTINGLSYYELACSPIVFNSSGDVDPSSSFGFSYASSFFDVSVLSGSDSTSYYACSLPVPLYGDSGLWSSLPSFPVGRSEASSYSCTVSLYAASSWITAPSNSSGISCFLVPFSSSSSSVSFSVTSGAPTDSLDVATFYSPLSSYPFAYRSGSSTIRSSYVLQGGNTAAINYSNSTARCITLDSSRILNKYSSFSYYPYSAAVSSANLALVCVSVPTPPSGGTVNSASSFALSRCFFAATLNVPVGMLPDVKVGDWISASPEDLQDAITNEFGVDSGKLKDSKNSITDWSNSESIDSAASDTALGFFGGLMTSGLAPCFVVVALLCFGAIMLHILLRKALD